MLIGIQRHIHQRSEEQYDQPYEWWGILYTKKPA